MTDCDKSTKKWSCEYCTYDNWPASKKCTLCRASKPLSLQYICEDVQAPEQNIYKLAPLVLPGRPDATGSTSRAHTGEQTNRWSCQTCTFLNLPTSARCVQCHKWPSQPPVPTRKPSDGMQSPLSVNVSISSADSGGAVAPRRISPRTSPKSPETTKATNNDKNKAILTTTASSMTIPTTKIGTTKWSCKACTYENWPRTPRCIICGVARGHRYTCTDDGNIATAGVSDRKSPSSDSNAESPTQNEGATASTPSGESSVRRGRRTRGPRIHDADWLWLAACRGVVDGDPAAVDAYLSMRGDPARALTSDECTLLDRPSAYEPGHTLIHLAIRFRRDDLLAVLLAAADVGGGGGGHARKRVPAHISPDVAAEILQGIADSLRQRKADFRCQFLSEIATFALPADIDDLPISVKNELFEELFDKDVQKELEDEEPIINWSEELTERLGSRLYALWNRTAGDCLLDSALQASWGVFDSDATLRRALADSLADADAMFYPRWKETEAMHAESLQFALDENQWQRDWAIMLSLASQPGAALEQIHVFAIAHILRRPIIVYGIKYVKSFRGENIGLAKFQGVYLPLLWEQSFCWRTPIALGYTRGHFSALVSMDIVDLGSGAGANQDRADEGHRAFLPLTDSEGKLLPLHFLPSSELGREEGLLRKWLDCHVTQAGHLVAEQSRGRRPPLVRQMLDEWLDRYRQLAHALHASRRVAPSGGTQQNLSSDEETDDE